MTVGVVDLLETIHVQHEQGNRLGFQRIPVQFVFEVVQEEATVVEAGKLVFKDKARGICANMLEKILDVFHSHSRPSL